MKNLKVVRQFPLSLLCRPLLFSFQDGCFLSLLVLKLGIYWTCFSFWTYQGRSFPHSQFPFLKSMQYFRFYLSFIRRWWTLLYFLIFHELIHRLRCLMQGCLLLLFCRIFLQLKFSFHQGHFQVRNMLTFIYFFNLFEVIKIWSIPSGMQYQNTLFIFHRLFSILFSNLL